MTVILASSSPRRKELLRSIGVSFDVVPSDVEEIMQPGESVHDLVVRLAAEKARSISARHPDRIVIAADTVVELEGEVLGKPEDVAEAEGMLARIAGRTHTVYTAVALERGDPAHSDCRLTTTSVTMAPMSREEIAWYVRTGEPMDKAGSYAIQGLGAMFVHSIDGNYTNVVGFPIPLFIEMMKKLGETPLNSAHWSFGQTTFEGDGR